MNTATNKYELPKRLRGLAEEWFEMCGDIHEPLTEAAERIEADAAIIAALQWQPIETAPKDGTEVIVGCFERLSEKYGRVRVDYWNTPKRDFPWTGWGKFNSEYSPATHWMPLPSPSALKGGDHG